MSPPATPTPKFISSDLRLRSAPDNTHDLLLGQFPHTRANRPSQHEMDALADAALAQRPDLTESARRRGTRARAEARQFRGLTCANCRARKVRCGGGQPSCKTCEIYNDECRYDKAPPMSQVMAMARRLQEAEDTIASLRAQRDTHSPVSPTPRHTPASAAQRPSGAFSVFERLTASSPNRARPMAPAMGDGALQAASQPIESRLAYAEVPEEPSAPDLSVDENGGIQYYGPTSAVHDPLQPQPEPAAAQAASATPATTSQRDIQSMFLDYAQEAKTWEEFALGNASLQTGIPRQIIAKLLHAL